MAARLPILRGDHFDEKNVLQSAFVAHCLPCRSVPIRKSRYCFSGARQLIRVLWFQRSGSFVVLAGAVLSYRSVVRLGIHGVGGVNTTVIMGKVESVDDSGPRQRVRLSLDEEKKFLREVAADRLCGYVGAILLVIGTLIWGYGDLLGNVFK